MSAKILDSCKATLNRINAISGRIKLDMIHHLVQLDTRIYLLYRCKKMYMN
jgi:hypothetical protein